MPVVILGGGGVGWANNVHCCAFSYTSAHTSCYVAVRSLTLFCTYVMLRCCTFSYTSDGVGWGGGWDVNVPCTSYIT